MASSQPLTQSVPARGMLCVPGWCPWGHPDRLLFPIPDPPRHEPLCRRLPADGRVLQLPLPGSLHRHWLHLDGAGHAEGELPFMGSALQAGLAAADRHLHSCHRNILPPLFFHLILDLSRQFFHFQIHICISLSTSELLPNSLPLSASSTADSLTPVPKLGSSSIVSQLVSLLLLGAAWALRCRTPCRTLPSSHTGGVPVIYVLP